MATHFKEDLPEPVTTHFQSVGQDEYTATLERVGQQAQLWRPPFFDRDDDDDLEAVGNGD